MATIGTVCGVFESNGAGSPASIVAGAFVNPSKSDILQIRNEGGFCIWSLNWNGVAANNPTTPTATALIQTLFGSTIAAAVTNNSSNAQNPLDILQIYATNGQHLLLRVTNAGTVSQS